MASGVLVDTSFLITLADDSRANHEAAVKYWKHFKDSGMPIYLSVIVVSEFEVKQPIPNAIRLSCIPIVFNWNDAVCAANFDRYRVKEAGVERSTVKDDMKIIAHAEERGVAYVITDDPKTFAKYCELLRGESLIKFQTIVLRDGFDPGYFRPSEPDLLTRQGI